MTTPISTSTPPLQVYPLFLAKNFVPSPSDSFFGRSYSPFNKEGGGVGGVPTMIILIIYIYIYLYIYIYIILSLLFINEVNIFLKNTFAQNIVGLSSSNVVVVFFFFFNYYALKKLQLLSCWGWYDYENWLNKKEKSSILFA